MPPPSNSSKVSTGSTGDHEIDENTKSDLSSTNNSTSDDDSKGGRMKYDGVGIVKSLLGPSFEDAVLKTFEFGKSLIQKAEDNASRTTRTSKEKKRQKKLAKSDKHPKACRPQQSHRGSDGTHEALVKSSMKKGKEGRFTRKRIVFTAKLDNELPLFKRSSTYSEKLSTVAKIRSLDSDLKQLAPSPEKIKRQLEALIQINKDEPPEYAGNRFHFQKASKFHSHVTVMPSLCICKNENEALKNETFRNENVEASSSAEVQSNKKSFDRQSSTLKIPDQERIIKRRSGIQSGMRQAPEFITNALGPSLDVSIMDNIKMMRNLFKCDRGKGEGGEKRPEEKEQKQEGTTSTLTQYQKQESTTSNPSQCQKQESTTSNPSQYQKQESALSALSQYQKQEGAPSPLSQYQNQVEYRIQELMTRVQELQEKEQNLIRQIEEEERERLYKRKAFKEEEQKLSHMKAYLEELVEEEKRKDYGRGKSECEIKHECVRQKIAFEEEKLSRLKDQHEFYKRDIIEAKNKKESLKRNKSLLDAWDVIASRACHTRLPSFSRAYNLERKQLKGGDNLGNIHCCFVPQANQEETELDSARSLCGKRSRCHDFNIPHSDVYRSRSKEQDRVNFQPTAQYAAKKEEKEKNVPFPIQRDITCGLHGNLKPCCCSRVSKNDAVMSNSDDEVLKKNVPNRSKATISRSISETGVKKEGYPKIVKVLWAITRINVFQDNCRTYEVMDATSTPPPFVPVKTEGIFVVKNSPKKNCPPGLSYSSRRRYQN